METTQLGATVAAAHPTTGSNPGMEFEVLVLRLLDEASWQGRGRVGGQLTKDALRRPTLRTIGDALARLARHPEKRGRVSVVIEQLHGWALALEPDGDGCLTRASMDDAREDGESDAALVPVLATTPNRVTLDRAIQERAEQIVSSQRVLRLLVQQRNALPAARPRRVRTGVAS